MDDRDGRDGRSRSTSADGRTDFQRERFMEQAAGSVAEAPPGTLYRSADVTDDAVVRDARGIGF